MGKSGSKLSAKERIGYEVFFFTAVYGLYNVFFALPLSVDALVFAALFGSLFVRYHLVVSDEDLENSEAAKWTGNTLLVAAVTITSHLVFKSLRSGTDSLGFENSLLTLVGAAVFAVGALAIANHPVFRYDEQRREMFKNEVGSGGVKELISRVCLFLDQQVSRTEYDGESGPFEDIRTVNKKVRTGEIETIKKHQARRAANTSKQILTVITTSFHVFLSVTLLLVFTALFELLWSIEAGEMLALVIVVASLFYIFVLMHLRFGLKREVSRSPWTMPVQFLVCLFTVYFTLFNAHLIGGEAIYITIPFILHLFSNRAGLLTRGLIIRLMYLFIDIPDEYKEKMKEAVAAAD